MNVHVHEHERWSDAGSRGHQRIAPPSDGERLRGGDTAKLWTTTRIMTPTVCGAARQRFGDAANALDPTTPEGSVGFT